MNYIGSNLGAILAATLVGLVLGLAYQILRPPAWLGSDGRRRAVVLGIVAAVAEFWLASILAGALILAPVQADAWTIAIGTAVVIWIGFVLPVLAVSDVARGMSWRVMATDCAHWLVVMVGQAVVLHEVGLVRP